MDDFKIVKDLELQSFYFNSGIYLNKIDKDKSLRENLKIISNSEKHNIEPLIANNYKYKEIDTLINSDFINNKNLLRKRIMEIYGSIDDEDCEDLDYNAEYEGLKEEMVYTDELIILSKTPFASNQQFDVGKISILYFKIKEINFGFIIDKKIVELLLLTKDLNSGGVNG